MISVVARILWLTVSKALAKSIKTDRTECLLSMAEKTSLLNIFKGMKVQYIQGYESLRLKPNCDGVKMFDSKYCNVLKIFEKIFIPEK